LQVELTSLSEERSSKVLNLGDWQNADEDAEDPTSCSNQSRLLHSHASQLEWKEQGG